MLYKLYCKFVNLITQCPQICLKSIIFNLTELNQSWQEYLCFRTNRHHYHRSLPFVTATLTQHCPLFTPLSPQFPQFSLSSAPSSLLSLC